MLLCHQQTYRKQELLFILKDTDLSKFSGLLSKTATLNSGQPMTLTRMNSDAFNFLNFHGKFKNIIVDSDSFAEQNDLMSELPKLSGIIPVLL